MRELLTLPNLLGGLRFLLAFVLLALICLEERTAFVIVLMVAFLLDAIDGPIARRMQLASEQGSRLDTMADFSIYMVLVTGVYWLWPQLFIQEIIWIGMAALSMLLPLSVSLIKFHTYTSYHTWLVKLATVCVACSSLLLLLGGPEPPFRFASIISTIAGLEQVIITFILDRPVADVRHLFAVINQRRKAQALKTEITL